MLSWPKTSRRLDLLADRLAKLTEETGFLRAALAAETERALAAEEQLLARTSAAEEVREQLQHLRDRVDEIARSGEAANEQQTRRLEQLESSERLERLEHANAERETEYRRIGLTLAKLQKRIDQQAQDATTTAAVLLERIGASR